MRALLMFSLLFLTTILTAQLQVYNVGFEAGAPAIGGPIPFLPEQGDSPSLITGVGFELTTQLSFVGNGPSRAQGLVARLTSQQSGGLAIPVEMRFEGAPFHGEVTEGIVEVEFDFVLEENNNDGFTRFAFRHGNGEEFASLEILSTGNFCTLWLTEYDTETGLVTGSSSSTQILSFWWHHITLRLDLDNNLLELYIDDTPITATTIGRFGGRGYQDSYLGWDAGFIGFQCLDNVEVRVPNDAAATLPVTWGEVSATWSADCDNVRLDWKTVAEQSVRDYRVETLNPDGHWRQAERRVSPGNVQYSLVHPAPASATPLYRVRATDLDGTVTFSPVFGPGESTCTAKPILEVYPNPAKEQLRVASAGDHPRQYRIIDGTGRTVSGGTLVSGQTVIPLEALPQGLYWLQTDGESVRFTKR